MTIELTFHYYSLTFTIKYFDIDVYNSIYESSYKYYIYIHIIYEVEGIKTDV